MKKNNLIMIKSRGRTATVNTNFNPKRKNGESKSYPLTRLPSDKEENHLPYSYYSALIGLLASSGARLGYLDSKVLRFTSTDLEWLEYVTNVFRKYFEFYDTPTIHPQEV